MKNFKDYETGNEDVVETYLYGKETCEDYAGGFTEESEARHKQERAEAERIKQITQKELNYRPSKMMVLCEMALLEVQIKEQIRDKGLANYDVKTRYAALKTLLIKMERQDLL